MQLVTQQNMFDKIVITAAFPQTLHKACCVFYVSVYTHTYMLMHTHRGVHLLY